MSRQHGTSTDEPATTARGGDGLTAQPTARGRPNARRLLRGLAAVSVAAVVLGLAGGVAQAIAERRDARTNPAPGDLVDVGDGRRIHLQVEGEGHGGPTVVLDAGLTGFSPIWAWVQSTVAEDATVVSYDRAGLGWSDPRGHDPSTEDFVADLHAALHARGLDGPYVLVGHSFGGLLARGFADANPDEVAALVLVDPAHEDQHAALGQAYTASAEQGARLMAIAHAATRVGLTRLHNPLTEGLEDLPEAEVRQAEPRLLRTDYLASVRAEAAAVDRVADGIRDAGGDLGDTPVRVLSAGDPQPGMTFPVEAVQDLHRRLTALSTDATHHVMAGAHHLTILTHREHAREVSAHITDVVTQLRAQAGDRSGWGGTRPVGRSRASAGAHNGSEPSAHV